MDINVQITMKDGRVINQVCQTFEKTTWTFTVQDGFQTLIYDLAEIDTIDIKAFKGCG